MQLSFVPTIDAREIRERLSLLLVTGALLDAALERRIERLAAEFASYAASYPLPLWAPGLALSNEMRGLTEALFPLARPRALFELILRRGCRFDPLLPGSYLYSSASWLDLLHKLSPRLTTADPAPVLRLIAEDDDARAAFLFALMLPQHFGGGFDRYREQYRWLAVWLGGQAKQCATAIRILDAACGSGEGTYQVAQLVVDAGLGAKSVVHGSTLEPIELFAAAHLHFPHDPEREREYRDRIQQLLGAKGAPSLEFYLDRVDDVPEREPYHLVLCNGLLGGPMLHEPAQLAAAFSGLSARLAPGGLLLAADRFHAGWRLRVPREALIASLRAEGLTPIEVPEGIAAIKP
ncbi:class I SAM-dependent methyltransferase [Geomonas anaerohicana]|uniref:Chemotaxis protein CheR n=1 Tax=Geomonas anaerohicana TaxID=2798583 RepID=A0ABS0YJ37_9BACT|nr:class I SAM-dependent methyltransferase [Geomonas anaerohicana]MBJ6752283.1 chemotaxis protein CheR [Geomonas anaerohicana]